MRPGEGGARARRGDAAPPWARRIGWLSLVVLLGSCRAGASVDAAAPEPEVPRASRSAPSRGGMWLPAQMGAHAEPLRELGIAFDPHALTDPAGFPLGAVVSLGGCTGSFVSSQGLVITNHHCVLGALQRNSTPARNLLREGFTARALDEELPAGPSQRVYVTLRVEDVTAQVRDGIAAVDDLERRQQMVAQRTDELEARCEAENPQTRCFARELYEGAEIALVEQLELRDIRLVHAPHESIGAFGGEVDNWQWPRHAGDYAFLRAYVDPAGRPAEYAVANVPYRPEHVLRVATEPLRADDLVLVAGYPAQTYRWRTAAEVADAIDWLYPRLIVRAEAQIAALEAAAMGDPELEIRAEQRLRRLHNYLTNHRGMLSGLQRADVLGRRRAVEEELARWIAAAPDREARWGDVLPRMAQAQAELRRHREHDAAVHEILTASDLLTVARVSWSTARARQAQGEVSLAAASRTLESLRPGYARELDRTRLVTALERAAELSEAQRPREILTVFVPGALGANGPTREEIEAAVDHLYEASALTDASQWEALLQDATVPSLGQSEDPFVERVPWLDDLAAPVHRRAARFEAEMADLRPRYVEALRAAMPELLPPDANGTLRVTYGTVVGYRPEPGASMTEPFTTLAQLVAKDTGEEPFDLPAETRAWATRPAGPPYVDAALADVPVNFLSDTDITGGNSGSPTLDAHGRLVGLAFDTTFEAIASDWMFMPDLARSIHVDIRFVLWLLEGPLGAEALARELRGAATSVPSARSRAGSTG